MVPGKTFNPNKISPFPTLKMYDLKFNATVSQSTAALSIFKETTGETEAGGLASVRWYARDDNHRQKIPIGVDAIHIYAMALMEAGKCEKSAPKLLKFLNDKGIRMLLDVELCVKVAFTKGPRHVTYACESTQEIAPRVYNIVHQCSITPLRTRGVEFVFEDKDVIVAIDKYLSWKQAHDAAGGANVLSAAKNAWDAAIAAEVQGPMSSGPGVPRRMKKNKNFHATDATERAAMKAAHLLEYNSKQQALEDAVEVHHEAYVAALVANGPSTLEALKELLRSYLTPALHYILHHVDGLDDYFSEINTEKKEGDLVPILKLFKAMRVLHPEDAKKMTDVEASVCIEYLCTHIPYIHSSPTRDDFSGRLLSSFSQLKVYHRNQMMPERLEVGDTCDVHCLGYALPRVASIVAKGDDTFDVKFLGESFVYGAPVDEIGVEFERVTPQVDSYVTYFEDYGDGDWLKLTEICMLLQASSADAERVFSQLSQMFTKQQMKLNQKWIFICIALRYNKRDI